MPTTQATASVRAQLLAEQILQTKPLLARYLAGFNDVSAVRPTPDLPNHLAWCLGHLALTMHRFAEKIDGVPPPASDFVLDPYSDGTLGSKERGVFDAAAVAFGSVPVDRHDRFPTLARAHQIYDHACDRLAMLLSGLSDERLNAEIQWGSMAVPIWAAATRMIFHNGFHTGQIADLRRALGFKSIFG